MLGRAFDEEGFIVVRGPDPIWGGDIRTFHPPSGKFDGIIGGPPCQSFSALVHLVRANGHEPHFGNLIPEFERCIEEAQPAWFVMENVPAAPIPSCRGYHPTSTLMLNNRWVGAEQNRLRRFCFSVRQDLPNTRLDVSPDIVALEQPIEFVAVISGNGFDNGSDYYARQEQTVTKRGEPPYVEKEKYIRQDQSVVGSTRAVPAKMGKSGKVKRTWTQQNLAVKADPRPTRQEYRSVPACDTGGHGGGQEPKTVRYSIAEAARLQGFPELTLEDCPFTKEGKLKAIANGVPKALGLAIARAVKLAMVDIHAP